MYTDRLSVHTFQELTKYHKPNFLFYHFNRICITSKTLQIAENQLQHETLKADSE